MRRWLAICAHTVAVIAAATLSWLFIDSTVWARAASGLFVLLSVLAAAVLVRLARPSPFSNPDVFTNDNVETYFAALRAVAHRLIVVLAAIALSVAALIGVIVLSPPPTVGATATGTIAAAGVAASAVISEYVLRSLSATIAALLVFAIIRIFHVVSGDLGFIELQRNIVLSARARKANETAAANSSKPTAFKSAGGYG